MKAKTIRILGAMIGGLCLVGVLSSAEPPTRERQISVVARQENVNVRYARACRDLANVELQLMENANKRFPRTFSLPELERKRVNVRVAERRLDVALKKAQGAPIGEPAFLSQAREQAELAKREYHRALETQNRDLVYSDLKLDKLRLEAEVAQLRLEICSEPDNLLSMIDHLNWQVERLTHEVMELQARVEELRVSKDD